MALILDLLSVLQAAELYKPHPDVKRITTLPFKASIEGPLLRLSWPEL